MVCGVDADTSLYVDFPRVLACVRLWNLRTDEFLETCEAIV